MTTTLFARDPTTRQPLRDSRGRFATKERSFYDKAMKENKYLRLQVQKYKRIAEVSDSSFIALQRICARQTKRIEELKDALNGLMP